MKTATASGSDATEHAPPADATTPPTAPAAEAAASDIPTIKKRAISGAIATLGGFGASQALRLGSNLVLTRLLFPEAFGLMAIVNIFIQGFTMFSDFGFRPAIVQHARGGDEEFLNTAWTIQIIRGLIIFACASVIAWPAALFYGHRELVFMLPAVGVNAILMGFTSTASASLSRKLILGRQAVIELSGQAVAAAVMIAVAYNNRSVWALVVGQISGTAAAVVLSHFALPGIRHRLRLEPEARRELLKFGRWITVSTAFSFLAMQGDRAILSMFVSMGMIGIYSIAWNLSQLVSTVCSRLTSAVLFPIFSSWGRQGPEQLRSRLYNVRVKTLALFMLPPCLLAIFGSHVTEVMYDDRYHEAGWMVSLLSLAAIPKILVMTAEPVLLATGDSYRHMKLTISRAVVTLTSMTVGGFAGGLKGILIGNIVGSLLEYPLLVMAVRTKGVWMPWLDLLAFASSIGAVALGRYLLGLWS